MHCPEQHAGLSIADVLTLQVPEPPTVVPAGACNFFVSGALGTGVADQCSGSRGRRPSNTMAKWFRAAFQPTIGIVHFFDASWIARYTSFNADSAFGYCLRFRVNLRITLFTDSIALVV